ncbi:MAG: rod shape-determining protein MreC [Clostridiales bacterium]|nr:rod shape-determining protein MreC [Clostridiales bacterium]
MARKTRYAARRRTASPVSRSRRIMRWIIGAAITVGIALIIMFVISRGSGQVTIVENAAGSLITPGQGLFSSMTLRIKGWFQNRQDYNDLLVENHELQMEIDSLSIQLQNAEEEMQENDRLKALLDVAERYESQDPVYAAVIAKDAGVWFDSFTINKGTLHGVSVNNAVITADGLVGRVYEVGLNYAKVRSIISASSSVACLVQRTRDNGVVTGQVETTAGDECRMNYLPNITSVVPGDVVVTSGVDMLFPKGIQVGTITSVSRQTDTVDKSVIVKPSVDFYHIEEVLVLRVVFETADSLKPIPTPSPKPIVTPKVTPSPTPVPGTTSVPTANPNWSYPTATPAPETIPTPAPTLPEESWAKG